MSVYTETDSPPENQSETIAPEDASTESPAQSPTPLEGEALENALRHQLECVLSSHFTQMNSQGFVSIDVIANFRRVKTLTTDRSLLLKVMRNCGSLTIDETGTLVKPNVKVERTTLILRDIPASTPVEEVKKIFESEQCPKTVSIRADVGDTWFVGFESQSACLDACEYVQSQTFNGKPISCGIKSESLFRGFYIPSNSGAPVEGNRVAAPPNGYPYGMVPPYVNYNPYLPNRQYNQQWQNHNYKASSAKSSTGSQSPNAEYKGGGRGRKGPKKGKADREDGQVGGDQPFSSVTTPIPMPPNTDKASPDKANGRRADGVQPQIASSQHFPPLPKRKAGAGYSNSYLKYEREQMAEIVAKLNQEGFVRPASYPAADKCVVVRADPLISCQLLEPFPVMYPASPSPLLAAQPNHSSMPYFDLNALTYFELPPASMPPEPVVGVPDLSLGPSQQSAIAAEQSTEEKPKSKKSRSRASSRAEEKNAQKEAAEEAAVAPPKPVSFAGVVGVTEKKDDSQAKARTAKAPPTKQQSGKPSTAQPAVKERKSREGKPPALNADKTKTVKPKPAAKPKAARAEPVPTSAPEATTPPAPRSAWTAAAAAPPKPKPVKSEKAASPPPTSSTSNTSTSSSSTASAGATSRKSKSDTKPAAETKPAEAKPDTSGKPFSYADMIKKADRPSPAEKASPPTSATSSPAKKSRADRR